MASCTCWVKFQDHEMRYTVRYGAHNPTCPVYRPSLDPVDNVKDAELRLRYEA